MRRERPRRRAAEEFQIDPLPRLSACPLRSDRVRTFAPQQFDALCPFANQVHCSKQRAYWVAFPTSTIRGTRIVKVEPRPGSLSTVMSPPII